MTVMNEALRIALERIDADSWVELCNAVPQELAKTLRLSVERIDNVVLSHCLVNDAPLGNRAMLIGLGRECPPELIDDLVRRFQAHDLKNFALQISPFAAPQTLANWLASAGLVVRSRWPKLLRGKTLVQQRESRFTIRRIGVEEAALFGEVSARGFGRPPIVGGWMSSTVGFPRWHHYVAFQDGQPAAAAALYIDGIYAWLGIGSTLPEFRSKGAQAALIARRIADGLAQGVEYFISETESFNTSYQNLVRAGFECVYARPNYGIPLPLQESPSD